MSPVFEVAISSRRGFSLPGRWSGLQATLSRLACRAAGLAASGASRGDHRRPHFLISEAVPGPGGARVFVVVLGFGALPYWLVGVVAHPRLGRGRRSRPRAPPEAAP